MEFTLVTGYKSFKNRMSMKNIKISEDVYEKLADALDALPAGFTRTPSKSEIKLDQNGLFS
ncbi:MAG: hypothetical protein MZV63_49670 [Marinilabiliales bacterium]|nr:hypothetical protein [Marinilabiliales bacterium]